MRERLLMDRDWRFALGHAADESKDFDFRRSRCLVKAGEGRGAAKPDFDDAGWQAVELPHDWALELPLHQTEDREIAEHGFRQIGPDFPQHSVGWYRKTFEIAEADLGKRFTIEFDGVFRDSVVWVNGFRMGRNDSGYTAFRYDVTNVLNYGGRNVVTVRAEASSWEGWWYEGAGIYRHVWLTKTNAVHIAHDGVQIISEPTSDGGANVTVRTKLANESDDGVIVELTSSVATAEATTSLQLTPWQSIEVEQTFAIKAVRLWSIDDPHLYTLRSVVRLGGEAIDELRTPFGVRSLRWDADKGFFLNGQHVKIKGTCNHQHHAGVGAAMPDALHEWKLRKLKAMGSNAYRCSHYMVTPELLDACDRVGMLVMCENRLPGGSDEYLRQLETQVIRDRNHPSIILWSLGNEEHTIQWAITGERIGRAMVRRLHELDPTRKVTSAMHDRGFTEGFMNVVDVQGWNYMKVGSIEKFRERLPHQPIVGSEESSVVTTRGIYFDDKEAGYVSAYDIRTPGWGTLAEKWWTFFDERPWLAGGFVWTGYDYFGEPIPYKWPCTSSHFGLMDLCGFPKDLFYYYKAWWGDQPVLHVFPHWNLAGREGQLVDVWCYTNHEEAELLVNGASAGRVTVKRNSHAEWKVPYAPGAIEVRGYRGGKVVESKIVETTGAASQLRLTPERNTLNADGEEVVQLTVEVLDAAGRVVPTACDAIEFEVSGAGRLLGVGNGDPSSHELNQVPHRRAFNGLAALLVKSTCDAGEIRVLARAAGLKPAECAIDAQPAPTRPSL